MSRRTAKARAERNPLPFNEMDTVYYRYQGGWGGGETKYAPAKVVRMFKSMVHIELIDARTKQTILKRVRMDSCLTREQYAAVMDPRKASRVYER